METNEKSRVLDMTRGNPFHRLEQFRRYMDLSRILHLE